VGEDGTGAVDRSGHLYARVCEPTHDTRRVITTDRLLVRALANTALHELGHFIADLDHSQDLTNFMTTVGPTGKDRNFEAVRDWYAGPKTWTKEQHDRLVEKLKSGVYCDPIQFK
jgi:hypothetical protein